MQQLATTLNKIILYKKGFSFVKEYSDNVSQKEDYMKKIRLFNLLKTYRLQSKQNKYYQQIVKSKAELRYLKLGIHIFKVNLEINKTMRLKILSLMNKLQMKIGFNAIH